MESPSTTFTLSPPSSTTTVRYNISESVNSPEFEFSNSGSNSQTTLLSADELFSDGFLLPLQLLKLNRSEPEPNEPDIHEPDPNESYLEPSALITSSSSSSSNSILSASKRFREIFKRTEKKPDLESKVEKKRDKEKKSVTSNNSSNSNSTGYSPAELNINIWPFSRSRSAGNNAGRCRQMVQSNRKVSSAPCSRSNSSGESKSRKSWPSSPGRTGVHLGRTSPVWHVKKSGSNRLTGSGNKNRVLKINVPVCMGYRQSLSCRSDESESRNGSANANGINGNSFSLRGLFSKKNNTTVLTV